MTKNDNAKLTETIQLPNEILGDTLMEILEKLTLSGSVKINENYYKICIYKETSGGEGWFLRTDIEPDKIYSSIEVYAKQEIYEFYPPMLLDSKEVSPTHPVFNFNEIKKSIKEEVLNSKQSFRDFYRIHTIKSSTQ